MTLTADPHYGAAPTVRLSLGADPSGLAGYESKPVEFWPTAAIRAAIETGDLTIWQRIVSALKRDPYGRTARQVEEVLDTTSSYGIKQALDEVLARLRADLDAEERAEVSRVIQRIIDRSGLSHREFASRIGSSTDDLTAYVNGEVSPSAALMVRMHRLAERFSKMRSTRPPRPR